ncbi:hypothetical protein [Pseudomonas monteilii]|uniref:hypothetical protein n=1 Tax=Pseudomonas monteilii TaxID=76759 RepID=UPI003F6DEE7D
MKQPNQYVKPSTSTTRITDDGSGYLHGSIRFNVADVRPEIQAATDVSVYVEALKEGLDDYLNGDEWREVAIKATPCEFRPAGSEATGQQIITMADRSVTFDPRKNWDNQTVEKGEVLAGSVIFTEATDTALVISHRASILDHNIQAGFTVQSMEQTAEKMMRDIEYSAAGKVAAILATAPSTESFSVAMPTGKPAEIAEDLIDILTTHVNQTVGHELSDFVVLLPVSFMAVLNRAAQRAGLDSIEDLIGAGVQPYTGTDHGIFMLPKLFTSLSYRERQDGNVWRIEATRNPNAQGWDLEIMAVVDIIANGMVKVKLTTDGLQTVQVPFPLVTRIALS